MQDIAEIEARANDSRAEALSKEQSVLQGKRSLSQTSHNKRLRPEEDTTTSMFLSLGSRMCDIAESMSVKVAAQTSMPSKSPASQEPKEEEEFLFKETVDITDDGIAKLDLRLRHVLRVPNLDPESWWVPPFASRVARPIRGATLYLESTLGPSKRVNEAIIRRLHDRNSAIPLHGLLAKNSSQSGPVDRQHIVDLSYTDPINISSSRKWQQASSPFEVVDCIINYICVVRMIRSYSHEGISLLSCLHTIRFYWSVVGGNIEKQKTMLVELCQSTLNKNQERAKCSRPPLEVLQHSVVGEGMRFSLFF